MNPNAVAACFVQPAFDVSLRFGASEPEIAARTGITRALLEREGATVTGDATYEHLELMFEKPDFGRFLVTAARLHTHASLGVVGLACKTVATCGDALALHSRFGHLTDRTASYAVSLEDDRLIFTEKRPGPPRLGNLLASDYAMLVATNIIREGAGPGAPRMIALLSRRARIDGTERRWYEDFLGPDLALVTGAGEAALHLDPSLLARPMPTADPEVAGYFSALIEKATATGINEDPLMSRVRLAVRDGLKNGNIAAATIAKTLGMSQRTLQRRLREKGATYAEAVEDTRRALCAEYLRDHRLSVSEISSLLGYDEDTSFFRAFRRWHGKTPCQFRREQSC